MMNQETYVKVQDLRKQGWTLDEIAGETGFHPSTISQRLKEGPLTRRRVPDSALVMNAFWKTADAPDSGALIETAERLVRAHAANTVVVVSGNHQLIDLLESLCDAVEVVDDPSMVLRR